jgi:hypothetical protein
MDLFVIFTGTCSKGWKNNSFALCQLQSVQRWFWRRWNECTFSSKWTGEIRGLYPWFVFIYSLGIQGTHKYNYSSFIAWTRIKCFHILRWGVYELVYGVCESATEACTYNQTNCSIYVSFSRLTRVEAVMMTSTSHTVYRQQCFART